MSTLSRPDDNALREKDQQRKSSNGCTPLQRPTPPPHAAGFGRLLSQWQLQPALFRCHLFLRAGASSPALPHAVPDEDQAGEQESLLPPKQQSTPDRVDRTEEASSSDNPWRLVFLETRRCLAQPWTACVAHLSASQGVLPEMALCSGVCTAAIAEAQHGRHAEFCGWRLRCRRS